MFADRHDVEQSLRRMFVRAVAGVDNAATHVARKQMGRSRSLVSHDHGVDIHGFDVASRIGNGFSFGEAAAGCGEVDRVGAQPPRGQREARARPRRVLKEQIRARAPFEQREVTGTTLRHPFEDGGRVQEQDELVERKGLEVEQVGTRPVIARVFEFGDVEPGHGWDRSWGDSSERSRVRLQYDESAVGTSTCPRRRRLPNRSVPSTGEPAAGDQLLPVFPAAVDSHVFCLEACTRKGKPWIRRNPSASVWLYEPPPSIVAMPSS